MRRLGFLLAVAAAAGCAARPGTPAAGVSAAAGASTAAPAPAAAEDDVAAIEELARRFSAAYVRGDAAAMTALYTPDAVIFPERSEAIAGREAIERYWTLRPGTRITHHRLVPTEIRVDGDHAYDHGVFEIAGTDGERAWGPSRGKYVVVWRRGADGRWRMHLDMWNSGPPQQAQPR